MFKTLLSWFFPEPSMCVLCQKPLVTLGLCPTCQAYFESRKKALGHCQRCHTFGRQVNFCDNCRKWSKDFLKVHALYPYEKEVREALKKVKYHHEPWRGEAMGRLLASLVPEGEWCLIPIPLHRSKENERGYNQSLCLAKGIAEIKEMQIYTKVLYRTKKTKVQAGLSYYARKENIKNAFSVQNEGLIVGKNLLLIDDIMTTGVTLTVATQALYAYGAKKVEALVFASGIH